MASKHGTDMEKNKINAPLNEKIKLFNSYSCKYIFITNTLTAGFITYMY